MTKQTTPTSSYKERCVLKPDELRRDFPLGVS